MGDLTDSWRKPMVGRVGIPAAMENEVKMPDPKAEAVKMHDAVYEDGADSYYVAAHEPLLRSLMARTLRAAAAHIPKFAIYYVDRLPICASDELERMASEIEKCSSGLQPTSDRIGQLAPDGNDGKPQESATPSREERAMGNEVKCELCGHALAGNGHGFDQNDARMDGDKLVHYGTCTYCRVCNPGLFAKQPTTPPAPEPRHEKRLGHSTACLYPARECSCVQSAPVPPAEAPRTESQQVTINSEQLTENQPSAVPAEPLERVLKGLVEVLQLAEPFVSHNLRSSLAEAEKLMESPSASTEELPTAAEALRSSGLQPTSEIGQLCQNWPPQKEGK